MKGHHLNTNIIIAHHKVLVTEKKETLKIREKRGQMTRIRSHMTRIRNHMKRDGSHMTRKKITDHLVGLLITRMRSHLKNPNRQKSQRRENLQGDLQAKVVIIRLLKRKKMNHRRKMRQRKMTRIRQS